jgi:hypothetical protein
MCKGFTVYKRRDLRLPKGSFDPLVSSSPISWRIGGSFTSLVLSSAVRGDYGHDGIEGKMDRRDKGHIEMGMQNLHVVKVDLEMAMVSRVLNVIQCHPIVQIIEWRSFNFHQGYNETLTCSNSLHPQNNIHIGYIAYINMSIRLQNWQQL